MSERRWEDLEIDCLVNVLKRLDMESLFLDAPFVCKSWYKASLNPLCWEKLVFPQGRSFSRLIGRVMDECRMDSIDETKFIKFIIDRSCKNATVLGPPGETTEEVMKYAAEECPALKTLLLHSNLVYDQLSIILQVIGKSKNLTGLRLGSSYNLEKILPEISVNCNNFGALNVVQASMSEEKAMSIVTNLPNIKYLNLKGARITRDNLVMILQGCKELEYLDVRDCIGYEADDKILELASHIRKFMHEGSKLEDSDDYDDFGHDPPSFYHYDGYVSN